ncbi:MAG: hypothetical protein QXM92_01575 [Candidatus Anstonellales archaeon]
MAARKRFKIFKEGLKRQGDGSLQAYQEYLQGKRKVVRQSVELGEKLPIWMKPFCIATGTKEFIKTFVYERNHKLHSQFIVTPNWMDGFGWFDLIGTNNAIPEDKKEERYIELISDDYDPAKVIIRTGRGTSTTKVSGITGKSYKTYSNQEGWSVPFGSYSDRIFFNQQCKWIAGQIMLSAQQKKVKVTYTFEPDYIRVTKTE